MEVVPLPTRNHNDVAAGLRRMADKIEAGEYGAASIAWVMDTKGEVSVGLLGPCAEPAAAIHLLLARGMRYIEK